MNAGIAGGATEILIPEDDKTIEDVVEKLKASRAAKKSSNIVLVAEGDQLGDVFKLASDAGEHLPEYDIRVSVLGHIQRGGHPSCADRVLGSRLGVAAVEQLMSGHSGIMVGVRNDTVTTETLHDAITKKPGINRNLMHIAEIVSL